MIQDRFRTISEAVEAERAAEEAYYAKLLTGRTNAQKVADGVAWYPVVILNKYYSVGEYIEVELERTKAVDQPHKLKVGVGCQLFRTEDNVPEYYQGVVSYLRRNTMKVLLRSEHLSLDDLKNTGQIGIEMVYDERPYQVMQGAIKEVVNSSDPAIKELREGIRSGASLDEKFYPHKELTQDYGLNKSQAAAVEGAMNAAQMAIIHGPPGTGKTTTLVALIRELMLHEKRVLVCAPSNNAVDLLARQLDRHGVRVLRIGNVSRIDDNVKLSITNDELKLDIKVIGQNYHEALWNLYAELELKDIELKCNGVSLNVYPSPMQFDMGLAYQGILLKMGKKNGDNVILINYNKDNFIKCGKDEQIAFYNRWILSKKKESLKSQETFIESITDKDDYLFFWGHQSNNAEITKSCFSQWWPCLFKHEGIEYRSAEQWMMAEKARIFSDNDILEKILKSNDPKTIKELGRQISFFDEDVWNQRKYDIVYEGNLLKFSQDESLKSFLLGTENKILVEASPYDKIWGIGMKQDEEGVRSPKNWKGQNLLGFALMEVRDKLKNQDHPS